MSRNSDHSPEEGRELTRRLDKMRRSGGVPDSVIHQEMLEDMERDLRQMARDYDGSDTRAKELLEALVIARESGVKGG